VADAAKSSTLDAKARASLLGEKLLPGKSAFDYMSKESRDRLVALTGRTDLPQAQGQTPPELQKEEDRRSLWSFVPHLDKDIAAAALVKGATGWMPYAEDPSKRARYVAFLEIRSGTRQTLPERPTGMTFSDWTKELQEFAHAAQVFKPTSGIMASRFTSATSTLQPASGDAKENNLLRTPTAQPTDPAEQAAKLGMYGPMTRTQFDFHPSRLLCKRFNVPPPAHIPPAADNDEGDSGARAREAVSKPEMDKMVHEYLTRGSTLQRPQWLNQTPAPNIPEPSAASAHATVDVEVNEALAKERAPEDVFKSIFGDDDDDD
jgi:G patch domain-containing protein 1